MLFISFEMKVVFLRHGESEYNVKGLVNTDPKKKIHLTLKGRRQAGEIREKLEGIEFDIVLVSEFLRAKETAMIVNEYSQVPMFVDKRLNEVSLGYEGKKDENFLTDAGADLFNFKGNGKESWHDLRKRIGEFLEDLKKENYENVLIVSHQWPIRVVNGVINNLSDEEAYAVPFGNCDFFEFEL